MPQVFGFDRLGFELELVRVQYLHHATDIGNARIIVEKLRCDFIRNLHSHIPIWGEYLELYIREVFGNGGLSRRTHVATAFAASVHHRITGSPGFVDDLGDLFQQHLFRDDDELAGLLGHVSYLSMCVFIKLHKNSGKRQHRERSSRRVDRRVRKAPADRDLSGISCPSAPGLAR